MYDQKLRELYEKLGKAPPSVDVHGTPTDIRENMRSINPRNWRMAGNELIADTDVGLLVQKISPDYICRGTDQNGSPILEKLDLASR